MCGFFSLHLRINNQFKIHKTPPDLLGQKKRKYEHNFISVGYKKITYAGLDVKFGLLSWAVNANSKKKKKKKKVQTTKEVKSFSDA